MATNIIPHFFPMASCELKGENGVQVCLYYQNPDNSISEHRTEPNGTLVTSVVVDKGFSILPNTPIAVTHCYRPNDPEVHLFYLDNNLNICKCQFSSGKWSDYNVIKVDNVPVTAAPYSQLAATCYTIGEWDWHRYKLIIYFQDSELKLREVLYYPPTYSWLYGHDSVKHTILTGSCLAAGTLPSKPHVAWCIFQKPDATFHEILYHPQNGCYVSGGYDPYQYDYRPGSSVSCVLYGNYSLRIYNITTDNYIVETFWDGYTWSDTTIVNNTKTTANSSLAVVRLSGGYSSDSSDLRLRVFYQVGNQQIHEVALDGGKWTNRGIFIDNSDLSRVQQTYRGRVAAD